MWPLGDDAYPCRAVALVRTIDEPSEIDSRAAIFQEKFNNSPFSTAFSSFSSMQFVRHAQYSSSNRAHEETFLCLRHRIRVFLVKFPSSINDAKNRSLRQLCTIMGSGRARTLLNNHCNYIFKLDPKFDITGLARGVKCSDVISDSP